MRRQGSDLGRENGHRGDAVPVSWEESLDREQGRYRDGEERLPDEPEARQRQLVRMANAANGAGLCLLMLGRPEGAREWLGRAAERYRESFEHAPPDSWGRPIGAVKARLLAGDGPGAEEDARWALELGAAEAASPIGRYAAALALLVLGRDEEARTIAETIRERDDFPADVADALATLAAEDRLGYVLAVESVLESFETRGEYLEDVAVADTVLVLQELARGRGLAAELESPLLPPTA
jgi:tetratricopeptide (TPR) repeat protein